MARFPDHFSACSEAYARYRPRYPEALFRFLADLAPGRALAWDCATGTGQAAIALTAWFDRVIATDASPQQLHHATPHPQVKYRLAPAEQSGLEAEAADLITVATALHWFDGPEFYAEAARVLQPGGVLAAWTYFRADHDSALQELIGQVMTGELAPYWPEPIRRARHGYAAFPAPFVDVPTPPLEVAANWTLEDLVGFVGTWSATLAYVEANRRNPWAAWSEALREAWGRQERRQVRWKLKIRVGRLPDR
jgi:SAM-dependent methyltransferase